MNWLRSILYNWLSAHEQYEESTVPYNSKNGPIRNSTKGPGLQSGLDIANDDERVVSFKIYHAQGGKIIETTKFTKSNSNQHENNRIHTMYVITEADDLTESLGRIITMDSLRG